MWTHGPRGAVIAHVLCTMHIINIARNKCGISTVRTAADQLIIVDTCSGTSTEVFPQDQVAIATSSEIVTVQQKVRDSALPNFFQPPQLRPSGKYYYSAGLVSTPGYQGKYSSIKAQALHNGIEAYNSLGLGERYHAPLRNTFRKLKISFPEEDNDVLLSFATKALNDILGPEGLIPSALVFGEYPSPHTVSENVSERIDLASRSQVADQARREMEK